MVILYVETNFIFSIAKGQDNLAFSLLENTPRSVQIVIPSICYTEALLRWQDEQKYNQRFLEQIRLKINDTQRDLNSVHARTIVSYLESVKEENRYLVNEVKLRLSQVINCLITQAETINLDREIMLEIDQKILGTNKYALIDGDVMDNLILESILHHAQNHPEELKVFLSNNTKDFGKSVVQTALNNVGISHYFSKTQDFLGWVENQSL